MDRFVVRGVNRRRRGGYETDAFFIMRAGHSKALSSSWASELRANVGIRWLVIRLPSPQHAATHSISHEPITRSIRISPQDCSRTKGGVTVEMGPESPHSGDLSFDNYSAWNRLGP